MQVHIIREYDGEKSCTTGPSSLMVPSSSSNRQHGGSIPHNKQLPSKKKIKERKMEKNLMGNVYIKNKIKN